MARSHRGAAGLLVSLLLISVLAAGCGSTIKPADVLSRAIGGTVTVATVGTRADCWPLRPASLSSASALVDAAILPSAFTLNSRGVWKLNQDVFSQVELSSTDPQVVVYSLNPQAVWSTGRPISSIVLIANWQAGKKSTLQTSPGYQAISSLIPGESAGQVIATFAHPFADWRVLFANLLPAEVLRGGPRGCTDPVASIDVSGGPFSLGAATPGRITLVRNPHWWGTPASLDRVVIRIAPSTAVAASWVSHNVAQLSTSTPFSTADVLRVAQSNRTSSSIGQTSAMVQLVPNLRTGPMAILELRQAVETAIDRFSLGQAMVGATAVSLGVLSSALSSKLVTNALGQDRAGASATTTPVPPTPEVVAGLGAAGIHLVAGHYVKTGGHPIVLTIGVPLDLPWVHAFASELSRQLHVAGFGVRIRFVPNGVVAATQLALRQLDGAVLLRTASQAVSLEAPWFLSAKSGGQVLANPGGYANAQVDGAFALASTQLNPVDAAVTYRSIDAQLSSDVGVIALNSLAAFQAWRTRLDGVSIYPYGGVTTQDAETWAILVPSHAGAKPQVLNPTMTVG